MCVSLLLFVDDLVRLAPPDTEVLKGRHRILEDLKAEFELYAFSLYEIRFWLWSVVREI